MIADFIVGHQAEFWIVIGFVLLAIEVLSGFVAGAFLFGGLGALTTGLLMSVGVLPETWIAGVACSGISSGVIASVLWKPLRRLQGGRQPGKDNSSDLVGHEFTIATEIGVDRPGSTNYSGIAWKVIPDQDAGVEVIAAGERVVVTSVEVGVFKVKPTR